MAEGGDHGEPAPDELAARWQSPAGVWYRYGAQRMRRVAGAPSIYAYRQPALDEGSAVERIAMPAAAVVLDAGCGRGSYLPYLARALPSGGRLVGLDFAPHVLGEAAARGVADVLLGDVQQLPFASDRFDVILSAHMLYHVPDIPAALREFRRALKPDGVLAIVVGTARDQEALGELFVAAGGRVPLARYDERFTADNAPAYLEGIFAEVAVEVVTPQLVIPEAAALVAHFEAERTYAEPLLRPGVTWARFLAELERTAGETIAREGAFRVPEEIAMLMCRG